MRNKVNIQKVIIKGKAIHKQIKTKFNKKNSSPVIYLYIFYYSRFCIHTTQYSINNFTIVKTSNAFLYKGYLKVAI